MAWPLEDVSPWTRRFYHLGGFTRRGPANVHGCWTARAMGSTMQCGSCKGTWLYNNSRKSWCKTTEEVKLEIKHYSMAKTTELHQIGFVCLLLLISKRPGVAQNVLQTPFSFIYSFIQSVSQLSFVKISSNVSRDICQMSHATCHVSLSLQNRIS